MLLPQAEESVDVVPLRGSQLRVSVGFCEVLILCNEIEFSLPPP